MHTDIAIPEAHRGSRETTCSCPVDLGCPHSSRPIAGESCCHLFPPSLTSPSSCPSFCLTPTHCLYLDLIGLTLLMIFIFSSPLILWPQNLEYQQASGRIWIHLSSQELGTQAKDILGMYELERTAEAMSAPVSCDTGLL